MKCCARFSLSYLTSWAWVHLLTSTGYLGSARHHHFLLQRGKLTSVKCLLQVFGTNFPASGFTRRRHGSLQVLSPFHASRSHHPSGSPRKGPSTSAGQGRPHSNKPAGQPGRAGSAAPTPPPHSRSSGHGTHHSVRHTQLHNITTAAPNNTRRGIITMVISPLSVSRGSSLAWPVSRAGSGGIRRSHPQQSQEQASRQAEQQQPQAAAAEKGTTTPAPTGRAASNAPPRRREPG
ncbi:hypothetical protein M758_N000800 [Ceratodon purpureus]|nr:hypothetical protein M758_N000800 [Ceratodon purpureus]